MLLFIIIFRKNIITCSSCSSQIKPNNQELKSRLQEHKPNNQELKPKSQEHKLKKKKNKQTNKDPDHKIRSNTNETQITTQAKIINGPNRPNRDQTQTNQSTHTNNKPTTTSESKPIHNYHHLGFITPQPPTIDPCFTTPTCKTPNFSHFFHRIKTLWPPWSKPQRSVSWSARRWSISHVRFWVEMRFWD